MFVADRMTPNPVTMAADANVADANEFLKQHNFRRIPVMNKGKLAGIVTDRDLRAVAPSPATSLSVYELNYLLAKMKLSEIMTKDVITVKEDDVIEEAALRMYQNKIGGLVVVNDQDEVVGVITETDIFKFFVEVMGIAYGQTTRFTIEVEDRVGIVSGVSDIFRDMGANIKSMVSYELENGHFQLVIRSEASNPQEIAQRLEQAGYPVAHLVEIRS